MKKALCFLFLFIGCSRQEQRIKISIDEQPIEVIFENEYEKAMGYNAAIIQFSENSSDANLLINLSNKKVVKYMGESEKENNSYAEGYHKALDDLFSKNRCTR